MNYFPSSVIKNVYFDTQQTKKLKQSNVTHYS